MPVLGQDPVELVMNIEMAFDITIPDEEAERIQNVGGSGWKLTEDQAIANLRVGADSYFVSVGGRTTEVVLATHNGRTYLKTQADGYAPNNLLDLPECP